MSNIFKPKPPTYNLVTNFNRETDKIYYWVIKEEEPIWYRPWKKSTTIPDNECPFAGMMPFFSLDKAEYTISKLKGEVKDGK